MNYRPEHAAKALEIVERLSPFVTWRPEYQELVDVLREPHRWKEAHAVFNRIRVNVTLTSENHKKQDLDACFVYVAENAAKTAYNCSGCSAPFDKDSFDRLLNCEKRFIEKVNEGN
ncbi:MAG: hypothetical protein ACYC6Y_31465 [Thermoguttaceae bacterium]